VLRFGRQHRDEENERNRRLCQTQREHPAPDQVRLPLR
jgi:hypothetical protein